MRKINYEKDDYWRLGFHLMPMTGWLNDPNGLCWFRGYYHFFFQYSPEDPLGGLKKWGHYRSEDLLKWEFMGISLRPEEQFEKDGIYSGSAFAASEGMHLFYTGNVKMEGDFNYLTEGRQGNTIYAFSEDGIHFSKKKCILTNADYPNNLTLHVRDPKVWKEVKEDCDEYFMVLGARNLDDKGVALIYHSLDLNNWTFCNEVSSKDKFGYMWECPDVFRVAEKKVLSVCPQGVNPDQLNYQNIYQSGYFIYEGELTGNYHLFEFKEWDRGFDFYAPQTFEDHLGRRILVAWMGMADTPEHRNPTVSMGWQHALTIPREIKVLDGQLVQQPVTEMIKLRNKRIIWNGRGRMQPCSCYETIIENHGNGNVMIQWENDLIADFDSNKEIFSLTFTNGKDGLGKGRDTRGVNLKSCRKIQVFVDASSIEIFLNDGEEVFTTRFYPNEGRSSMMISGEDYTADAWELNKMIVYN